MRPIEPVPVSGTMTRTQIREIMDLEDLTYEDFILCMIALHGPTSEELERGLTVEVAMARCAELWNPALHKPVKTCWWRAW